MKRYSSYNNNASCFTRSRLPNYLEQSKMINNCQDDFSHSSYNSQTLGIIHSIVDELYQINNQESLSKEKRVRFTLEQETDKIESVVLNDSKLTETSIKYQPVLSESSTVVCCLIKGRSKVDSSVSTNDLPSFQCECATQTMDITNSPEYDLHRSKSNITLSTASISSRSTIILHPSSLSISNHLLYSCENNNIESSLSTARQLRIPSDVKHYDICQEQMLENYNTFIDFNMKSSNSSTKLEEITKLNAHNLLPTSNKKLSDKNIICICSKRKLSDPVIKCTVSDQGRLLEELHLSKRSLQSMQHDGLSYVHDLVFIFLRNIPQFYQILVKHYYVSKKQANLYAKVMEKWWKKYQKVILSHD